MGVMVRALVTRAVLLGWVVGCAFDSQGLTHVEGAADGGGEVLDTGEGSDAPAPDGSVDAAPPSRCPEGYPIEDPTQGSCYRLEMSQRNWGQAQTGCAADGGHLVVLDDVTENDYVRKLDDQELWIGLTDAVVEGVFVWVNGDPLSFTNWDDGEPNNFFGEDCASLNAKGLWNDLDCGERHRSICEHAFVP